MKLAKKVFWEEQKKYFGRSRDVKSDRTTNGWLVGYNRFTHILHENVAGRRQGTKHKHKPMRVSSGYQEI